MIGQWEPCTTKGGANAKSHPCKRTIPKRGKKATDTYETYKNIGKENGMREERYIPTYASKGIARGKEKKGSL